MSVVIKRLLAFLFVICMLITLASCRSEEPISTDVSRTTLSDTTAATVPAPVLPDGIILAGQAQNTVCTITYPASDSTLQAAAEALAVYINAILPDAGLIAVADNTAVSTEYQIALCSPDSALSVNYAVKLEGKQIRLCGTTAENTLDAVRYFKSICITDGYLVIDEALDFSSAAGPDVLSQYPEKYYYYAL